MEFKDWWKNSLTSIDNGPKSPSPLTGEGRPARHRPPEADSGETGGGEGEYEGIKIHFTPSP